MEDSPKNSPSTWKQNVLFLKDREVNPDILIGVLMHLFLILCLIILLYLLAKQFLLIH